MTTITSYEQHLRLIDEWALAIGRFIMTFSECEWFTHKIIEIAGTTEEQSKLQEYETEKRARIAEAIALRNLDQRESVLRTFQEFHSINGKRKLLAHNTPAVDVYVGASNDIREFRLGLCSFRNSQQTVDLTTVRTLTRKALETAGELLAMSQTLSGRQ
jgi:hypothetical protein